MIVATATGENDTRIIVLGVSRENITRLTAGQPIRVDAAHHPGFPADTAIMIIFGETERAITEQLGALIGPGTKVVAVPRDKGRPQ